MARSEMLKIVDRVETAWPGVTAAIHHRVGRLVVGDVAVIAAASHAHRAQAFEACREIIEAHHGHLTAAQGRSYEHSLRSGWSLELSAIARLLWGRGGFGARFHALPPLALCLRDHGLTLPDLTSRAFWDRDGAQEWCFRQGENGFAALYHYKTRAYALGTGQIYVNLRGREGQGIVAPGAEYDALLDAIARELEAEIDPATGARFVDGERTGRVRRRDPVAVGRVAHVPD